MKVVNFMSAPRAGKTALLEQALPELDDIRVGVLEGDVQGSLDADRLAARAPRCRDDARKRSDRCRDRAVQGLARRGRCAGAGRDMIAAARFHPRKIPRP